MVSQLHLRLRMRVLEVILVQQIDHIILVYLDEAGSKQVLLHERITSGCVLIASAPHFIDFSNTRTVPRSVSVISLRRCDRMPSG